jgi:hypothetical protein
MLLLVVRYCQLLSSLPWGSGTVLRTVVAATWLAVKSCRPCKAGTPDQIPMVLPGERALQRLRFGCGFGLAFQRVLSEKGLQ